jgi:hypothetical protein
MRRYLVNSSDMNVQATGIAALDRAFGELVYESRSRYGVTGLIELLPMRYVHVRARSSSQADGFVVVDERLVRRIEVELAFEDQ